MFSLFSDLETKHGFNIRIWWFWGHMGIVFCLRMEGFRVFKLMASYSVKAELWQIYMRHDKPHIVPRPQSSPLSPSRKELSSFSRELAEAE